MRRSRPIVTVTVLVNGVGLLIPHLLPRRCADKNAGLTRTVRRRRIPLTCHHGIACYTVLRVARAAHEVVTVANQNITLSLPEEDLREARVLAARRGTSVSQLLARMLRETVERETGYDTAKERSLALLREGMDLGTSGRITWSRGDLHER